MEQVMPGLHATTPEALSFAPEFRIRAYLLQREKGNLLIYSTGTVVAEKPAIEALGGIARRYMNHAHEAGMGCAESGRAFDAPLLCHERDREEAAGSCIVAETFTRRHRPEEDFEVIPIPGHTPGATAYLWENAGRRCLFTGDSLHVREDGEWGDVLLASSDRDAFLDSMALLREVDFDMLVPWTAVSGAPCRADTDRTDARRRLDAVIERVRRCGEG